MTKQRLLTSKPITKEEAISLFGSGRGAQKRLAEALGLSKQAVSDWADGAPIPKEHDLRLRYELKPEAFAKKAA